MLFQAYCFAMKNIRKKDLPQSARIAFTHAMLAGAGLLVLASPLCSPAAAQADFTTPVVIEMFTSQGCSSCPPADRLLDKLARKPNVIALTLPVDYWDYIGWKDTLASPAFTARQKAYARTRRDGHVYTPQAIIDGLQHGVGSDFSAIKALARSMHGRSGALQVTIQAKTTAGTVICALGAAPAGGPDKASLWLFRIVKSRDVKIGRGENSGRMVKYVNVVRSMQRIGEWSGAEKTFEIAPSILKQGDSEGWVLLLQSGSAKRPGAILAAAKADGF
ncbi:MAG: DUF1223 domain-containing protein [Beijerinckiaceae bacterium]|jgi:hypothetical protein|nr:DUF1223 domain-containing protein [Beijerinckiaceae bacterium]